MEILFHDRPSETFEYTLDVQSYMESPGPIDSVCELTGEITEPYFQVIRMMGGNRRVMAAKAQQWPVPCYGMYC